MESLIRRSALPLPACGKRIGVRGVSRSEGGGYGAKNYSVSATASGDDALSLPAVSTAMTVYR